MELEPRRLVVLHTVERAGGIAAAARLLGITPSAVSQAVRRLEREAGVALLDRTGGRADLTATGRALAERGGRIAAELALAAQDLTAGTEAGGPVVIGAVLAVLTTFVARVIPSLTERHPALRPCLREVSNADGLRALHRGELDVLLATADHDHRPDAPPGYALKVLMRNEYSVGVPTAWGHVPCTAAELASVPWIGAPRGHARAHAYDRLAAEHGLPGAPLAHEAANWSAVVAMTAAGLGAVVLPRSVASRTPGLTMTPVAVPGAFETLVLHRAVGDTTPPAVAVVLARLAEGAIDAAEEMSRTGMLDREPIVTARLH
ncbi:LysR family transcriptional regulator [Streptantibioticus silvisoli]|uniref:LysR family transcriptional regulator n=1 Tax=Streptantibioticus silvisoli TaxID=2705255 RepID=A0ABT6VVE9_9ACTN|nr:LysR family transcriptional regulator [Streptantibioticus silvisoli]MDI5962014.1 LysR family transcriptional regulator [Streptantibioticus silvisoli]